MWTGRRIVVPAGLLSGEQVRLEGAPFHYLAHVLRLAPGSPVELVDGSGYCRRGQVLAIGRKHAEVHLDEIGPERPSAEGVLSLVYGLSRAHRTEWVWQKATELGADRLVPVLCERSVSRPAELEPKLKRWRDIVAEASRQCRRDRFPELLPPSLLKDRLDRMDPCDDIRLAADPSGCPFAQWRSTVASEGRAVTLAVGPEGGFTASELEALAQAGFVVGNLGPRVLRTETAAVALLAIVSALMGRL